MSQYRAVLDAAYGLARCVLSTLAAGIAGAGVLGLAGHLVRLRIRLTDSSTSAGVYRLVAAPAGRGALVAACLPTAIALTGITRGYLIKGDCPAGAEPVAKVIGALPGDVVQVEPDAVAVNGARFSNSRTAFITLLASENNAADHVAER